MAKSIIGLDIGANNVKAVELVEGGKELIIKHVGFAEIEAIPDLTNDEDRHKALIKAIKAALPQSGLKTKRVVTALSGKAVINRTISLPRGPVTRLAREDVKKMIIAEIEAEIPFPVEDAAVDFYISDDLATLKEEKVRVAVAVVPKTEVDKNIALMNELGLEQEAIDVVPFALRRGLSALKPRLNVEITGVIDLGAATTEVVIAKGLDLLFTRNVPLGGNLLTRVIQDILNLDYAKAENAKKKEGLPPTVAPQFERIATEIRNSLSYFQLQEHKKIDLAFVCGGGGKLREVLRFLKEKIDIPLEIANALENIKSEIKNIPADLLTDIAPFLITAIGLAMKARKNEKRFNFLPEELRQEGVSLKGYYVGAGLATVSMIIILYLLLTFKIKQKENNIADLKKALSNLQYVVDKTQESAQTLAEVTRLEGMLKDIFIITPPFAQIVDELIVSMPATVWLRELAVTGEIAERAAINAKVKKSKIDSALPPNLLLEIVGLSTKTAGVANFMLELKKWPHFTAAELSGAKLTDLGTEQGVSWSIKCKLLNPLADKDKKPEVKK
ncbi:MAG: type IV pilus assembly protein PilM [Elusimicrobia bacterium]|nr:type IV pilus assembly protein PilM [Elusimicrobiota bacterium]